MFVCMLHNIKCERPVLVLDVEIWICGMCIWYSICINSLIIEKRINMSKLIDTFTVMLVVSMADTYAIPWQFLVSTACVRTQTHMHASTHTYV
jgi:hypothetical protein